MSSILSPTKSFGRFRSTTAPRHTLRAAFQQVLDWQSRATERWRLRQLDDRMLRDVGLTREQALGQTAKRRPDA